MGLIAKVKVMMLVPLLKRAAESLQAKQSQTYLTLAGDFGDTQRLAGFVSEAAEQFRNGDYQSGRKLWDVFAPTCEWDDAAGSQSLGNMILGLLDPQFRPERDSK